MKRKFETQEEFQEGEKITKRKLEEEEGEEIELEDRQRMWGDGEHWLRGELIGEGTSASVFLATPKKKSSTGHKFPPVMAVKSAKDSDSDSMRDEAEILLQIEGSPFVIERLGEEITTSDDGDMVYNLLLEYAAGGSLGDALVRFNGRGLPEQDVKKYTKSILEGLNHIHNCDYVHCDLKSENILLVGGNSTSSSNYVAKIGDFGLSKKSKEDIGTWRGTRDYLSPEALNDNEQEEPSDIWSLGCVVLEMLTGKPIQDLKGGGYEYESDDDHESDGDDESDDDDDDVENFNGWTMFDQSCIPKIPEGISGVARDFVKSCLAIRPEDRLTAQKLLLHPFVAQPSRPPKAAAHRLTNLVSSSCLGSADIVPRITPPPGFKICRIAPPPGFEIRAGGL